MTLRLAQHQPTDKDVITGTDETETGSSVRLSSPYLATFTSPRPISVPKGGSGSGESESAPPKCMNDIAVKKRPDTPFPTDKDTKRSAARGFFSIFCLSEQ